jgi:NAD(P)-dependent dehydrogenase (short-subunit alcohol dehydrogenase family)
MRGLTRKVVVVAGGAGGIGTATSVRLSEEGAAVVVGDVNVNAAEAVVARIRATGGTAIAVQVDISDDASVAALVEAAIKTYGGVDMLHVNAAANTTLDSDALSVPLEVFDQTIAVDLRGHLLCTRHTLPELLKRGGGAIVYTSSGAAFVGQPERPCYAMAKSGLHALVRHVATRWGKKGVRANAVAPGLVVHEGINNALPEGLQDAVLRVTPSPRLGKPEDVAAMVAFLFSDDGQWINGQVISVDGGGTQR